MRKKNCVYLLLSVLEGLLSGGYFYLAKRDREPLDLMTGCLWLAVSVFHGVLGIREEEHILLVEEEDYE